ncbi:MAG: DUF4838 domain-containing protein [Bacteroidota bacterium]
MSYSQTMGCLTLLTGLLFSGCESQSVTIASGGETDYEIYVPKDAREDQKRAAFELRAYLQSISGAEFSIVQTRKRDHQIRVEADKTSSSASGVYYGFEGSNLIVSGSDAKYSLYAVYTFLEEQLGCRFYTPNHEWVPRQSKIILPSDLNSQFEPDITVRTVHSQLFYEDSTFADKRKVSYEAFPKYVPEARVHTFHRFIPADQFLKEHPEYYALRNGRRIPTQLCLTNEEVFRIVRDSVSALIKRYPDREVISVSQDDNTQYCQCDNCRAIDESEGSPSGSMISFVNRIADEFPDKMISTLAYQYTRKAPKNLKPKDNVLITLCSIECDRSASIAEKCEDFYQDLVAWGKISDNVRIWDYTTQFTNFLAPFPNLRTLQPNVQLFRDNSARWVFEQHSRQPSELFELRSYLTAKLLWNPDLDVQTTTEDFLEGYYEEAAPFIHQYIELIHDELEADSTFFLFLYGDPSQGFGSFLGPDQLVQYERWFDEAENAVKDKPSVLQRVRRARLSVDYAGLEAARKNLSSDFTLATTSEEGAKATPSKLMQRLTRFEQTCKESDITAMNEMRFTVDEYLSGYRATLARSTQKNIALDKPVTLETAPKKYANEDPQTLTDGAFGGANFYANWLGFEGNDAVAIVDLEEPTQFSSISTAFLQVVNHIVFFPEAVEFEYSLSGQTYQSLGVLRNQRPLSPNSKINDTQYFDLQFPPMEARFIKVTGKSMKTAPIWHHGAGLPSWIFIDEVMVR